MREIGRIPVERERKGGKREGEEGRRRGKTQRYRTFANRNLAIQLDSSDFSNSAKNLSERRAITLGSSANGQLHHSLGKCRNPRQATSLDFDSR